MDHISHVRDAHVRRVPKGALSLVALMGLLGGCMGARPMTAPVRAPDLDAHEASWHARRADAPAVRHLAARDARGLPPFRLEDGVTLHEAEWVALVFDPALRVARLEARVPAVGAREAGRPPDPEIEVDVLRILQGVSSPWILGGALGFTVPLSHRLPRERALACAEAAEARAAVVVAERDAVVALRMAWIDWTATVEEMALVDAHLADLGDVLTLATQRREAGQMSGPDVGVLDLARLHHAGRRQTLEARARQQTLALKRRMGLVPDARAALVPGFGPDIDPPSVADARSGRLRQHPRLRRTEAAVVRAERALALAQAASQGDLHVGPLVEREEGATRLGGSVGGTLPLWNRNRRAVAEARARRDLARHAHGAAFESAVGHYAEARVAWQGAAERLAWLTTQLLPRAERQLAEVRALGEVGDLDVLVLREALDGVFDARAAALAARTEAARQAARIRGWLDPLVSPVLRSGRRGGTR